MSTFRVPLTTIRQINEHPNADSLVIAKIYDWDVVVKKGDFNVGDEVLYIPVDSILSPELESKVFGPDSKIKLNKSRIRSIKLRGQISQGLAVKPSLIGFKGVLEENYAETLGVVKYEPPEYELPKQMQVKATKKKNKHSHFKEYSKLEHFKYFDRVIQDGEIVYVSAKLHGTNARYGWAPTEINTLFKRIKKFLGLLPEYEFVWGSRTVEISSKPDKKHVGVNIPSQGVNFGDVYTKMIHQYDLMNKIPKGRTIYGEIVGDGIQANYPYGCGKGEHRLFIFDVMDSNTLKYLNYEDFKKEVDSMELDKVPELYVGPWDKEVISKLRDGTDLGCVREGIVVKPVVERSTPSLSRLALKWISDAYYLMKHNTEYH